jgi:hypothetical protein
MRTGSGCTKVADFAADDLSLCHINMYYAHLLQFDDSSEYPARIPWL